MIPSSFQALLITRQASARAKRLRPEADLITHARTKEGMHIGKKMAMEKDRQWWVGREGWREGGQMSGVTGMKGAGHAREHAKLLRLEADLITHTCTQTNTQSHAQSHAQAHAQAEAQAEAHAGQPCIRA